MSPDPDTLPETYWLTRDRWHGDLKPIVEVWTARPLRYAAPDGDVMWCPADEVLYVTGEEEAIPHNLGEWTIAEAYLRIGPGIPETDRECVRVGPEPAPTRGPRPAVVA